VRGAPWRGLPFQFRSQLKFALSAFIWLRYIYSFFYFLFGQLEIAKPVAAWWVYFTIYCYCCSDFCLCNSGLDYATLRVAAPNSESCASSCICWLCLSRSRSFSVSVHLCLVIVETPGCQSERPHQKPKKSECQSGRSNQQANLLTCRAKRAKKSEGKSPQVSPTQMWQISRLANGNSQFLSFCGGFWMEWNRFSEQNVRKVEKIMPFLRLNIRISVFFNMVF